MGNYKPQNPNKKSSNSPVTIITFDDGTMLHGGILSPWHNSYVANQLDKPPREGEEPECETQP